MSAIFLAMKGARSVLECGGLPQLFSSRRADEQSCGVCSSTALHSRDSATAPQPLAQTHTSASLLARAVASNRTPGRFALCVMLVTSSIHAATPSEVKASLVNAVTFMHSKAATHGGYVYRISADLTLREAEGIPGPDTIWIQPPGTTAVGEAMLDAFEATGDAACLKAAVDAAHAVSRTQLQSGGWDYSGDLGSAREKHGLYARSVDGRMAAKDNLPAHEPGWHLWKQRKFKLNLATLDDDVTQSATRLLVRVDAALKQQDELIHDAAGFALIALRSMQYPNGAWSASFDALTKGDFDKSLYPIKPASYPADWPRKWPKDFTGCYVLNDNLHATAMRTLLLAAKLDNDTDALAAAKRAGDFLILAQMPDPQPAWAQQYDADMHPCWSRAFEPSSISGRESQAVMWALLRLVEATGDKKYLAPIPRAVEYLKKSRLPNGNIARFYELQTNRPLYFVRGKGSKGFELSYDGTHASSNYGWEWNYEGDAIMVAHDALMRGAKPVYPKAEHERWSLPPSDADVDLILKSMSSEGAWLETGDERGWIRDASGKKVHPPGGVIHSDTFVQNVRALSAWLKDKKS